MQRPRRYSLAIELTAYCNQTCGYCYNDWRDAPARAGSLSGPALLAAVDRALTAVQFDHVTLTGGEPFARAEFFEVLDMVARHGLRALIISNGGVITERLAERLAPYRPLFVQVTLNGPDAALHEAHVGVGHDHWGKTLAGIAHLQRAGVTVHGSVVVTRQNARRLGATLALWRSLGVHDVALSRYSPAGYAAEQVATLLPSRAELVEAFTQAQAEAAAHAMRLQVTMPTPPCVIDTGAFPALKFSSCPIGTEMQEFAMGPRGELRHCTLHTETLASALDDDIAAAVTSPAVAAYRDVTPAFCEGCAHRRSCIGGCGAAAAAVLGDPRGLDPIVAQHVDDAFRAKLRRARGEGEGFVPLGRLARRVAH